MLCGYCAANTQEGEPHSRECQVFRFLNDHSEYRESPYETLVASVLAASELAYREGLNMTQEQYVNIRLTVEALKKADPAVSETEQGLFGRIPTY